MLAHHLLSEAAAVRPDSPALIAGGRRLDFAALERDSDRLAAAFQRQGVRRGDRVLMLAENVAATAVALWAALKAGAVFVPVNPLTPRDRLAAILADVEPCCLMAPAAAEARLTALGSLPPVIWIGDGACGPRLADLLAEPQAALGDPRLIDEDLALILYTSGSTGAPRGVALTHRTVRNNARAIALSLGNQPEDVVLCVLPLFFGYGLFQLLAGAQAGYAVVLERSAAFPYEVLKRIGEHRVTNLPGVPTLFAALLPFAPFTGLDLGSLRICTNAAAPLSPAHIGRLRETLPRVDLHCMYGLTECTRVSTLAPSQVDRKPASVGRPIPNCEAWVVDEAGRRLPQGEVGELVVRGANLMRGYWRRPEDTARVLRPAGADAMAGDRVLHTGDLFRIDAEGDLLFVGRCDDVFKCRGEKVAPAAVEHIIYELDAVAEAAVVGLPDPVDGMSVKAFVVPAEGRSLTERAVREPCRRRLDAAQVPRCVEFRATLPRTASGKISRAALRPEG